MLKRARVVGPALLAALVLSCGGGGDTIAPPVLTTLNLSFPQGTLFVGQSSNALISGVDQHGAAIPTGTISWSTQSAAVATVNSSGVVTGVGPGQTRLTATAGAKQAQTSVTVIQVPVASVGITPTSATITAPGTKQLTASTFDPNFNILTGRVITWSSSDQSLATVDATGLVTGVGAGVAFITATSEGKSGTAQITVNAQVSCAGAPLALAVGEVHVLTAAEKASVCIGGGAATEYALIPFNGTPVAASTISLHVTATNTSTIVPGALASVQLSRSVGLKPSRPVASSFEWQFRQRERRDLPSALGVARRGRLMKSRGLTPSMLTGIPANPTVGSIVSINANLSGNTCSNAKQLHGAMVIAVLPHTIILSDTLSPAGGYTGVEMTSFGEDFDNIGYALDVQNFGDPTDIDANGRVAILFTPGVNSIPAPPGAVVGGLFADRDLFPVTTCAGSNEGEMFYLPVPDPNATINGNYKVKDNLARGNLGTLVHEFQHLINSGRRIYVNNADSFEEVWLNEGLSHIAEELLYYRISGNVPRSNIDLSVFTSSQEQLDAANAYMLQNMGRLSIYMRAPESNSPFGLTDLLEMRGAIWQLLRYSADRKGGTESSTWQALVNSTTSGQANFTSVFGDIMSLSRNWVVAQFLDDAGLSSVPNYSHPSWNYRSLLPPINSNKFPLMTRPLLDTPLDFTLNGGSASYIRFRVLANIAATIGATSAGQPVPASVDFFLIRTQ
jgi:Bacterial Ig-like domain (group 2)